MSIRNLNRCIRKPLKAAKPPEDLTVSEWADKFRYLSPENSAEAGPWRTARTPYLKEPMDAFTDPRVRHIVMVAGSQVGKTELLLNSMGFVIDQDPSSMMHVQPTVDIGEDFSKRRIAPMVRDTKTLKSKVAEAKAKDGSNTVRKKQFPGGMLTITGANSPASLASIPSRYIFGDEIDRWPPSAGTEGDPWKLVEARTTTFYNAKMVAVSTPTIKGHSAIEKQYKLGTRETWRHECPSCGQWHAVDFDDIKFDSRKEQIGKDVHYEVDDIWWQCPTCPTILTEQEVRRLDKRWVAENPAALKQGVRSFWLNAFVSPWLSWSKIVLDFLQAQNDPEKLQVVFNTKLGKLWEVRDNIEDETDLLGRREAYGAELPEGVLALTCGVDTQDDRLEYEIVGHGHYGSTWGIRQGFIMGRPDNKIVWKELDAIIDKVYKFENGKGLKVLATCVDSGGHFTQEVYMECRMRQSKRVVPIKGRGGDGIPFTAPPKRVPLKHFKNKTVPLYSIGVDAGKSKIMSALQVQEKGANYCHFPAEEDRGYDSAFFRGLLSEKLTYSAGKWRWTKVQGRERNERLDCRNYALAAFNLLNVDLDRIEAKLKGAEQISQTVQKKQAPQRRRGAKKSKFAEGGIW